MDEWYLVSLLLMSGVCMGFAVHAVSLAARSRGRRHYLDLFALAVLQAAYCLLTHYYFRELDRQRALTYGHALCIVTPYITYFFGQLVLDLTANVHPWLRRYQRLNLLLTTLFVATVAIDWIAGTQLALTGQVTTALESHYRHRLFFAPAGLVYLGWVSVAFMLFSVALFRDYQNRRDLLPIVIGCVLYFASTTMDFGILVGFHEFYFLQHFGFSALVATCWFVVAGRYERTVEDLEHVIATLEDQRRRLLLSPRVVQQQKLNALGTLAAGVAHEVNNPVQGILGYAELLRGSLERGGSAHGFASQIAIECHRVAEIVRGLLRFARKDDGKVAPVRIPQLLEDARRLLDKTLQSDAIELTIEIDSELPQIYGQSQQLRQVIMNLLTNARDAVNERDTRRTVPKRIWVCAFVRERQGEPRLVLEVRDNGDGIDPTLSERIFDPFFTTKDVGEGTGLGLSISHGIVASHGGELECESTQGHGTCFRVELPIAQAHYAGSPKGPSRRPSHAPSPPP